MAGIAHREWAIHRSEFDTDEDFRQAVEQETVLNVHLMDRLGVGVVQVPLRQESGGEWFTMGYVFQTASVPGAREPELPAEVFEPEGALVEDGVPEPAEA